MFNFFQKLQVGDEILKFGSITSQNFQSLQDIAAIVQHSKGVRILHWYLKKISTALSTFVDWGKCELYSTNKVSLLEITLDGDSS